MTPGAPIQHLSWRLAGLVLLAVCVVAFEPGVGGAFNRVLLPVLMALATWLLVQNLAAVALGAALLAGIHSTPGGSDPIASVAYPALGLIASGILLAVLLSRFRRRMADTHEARWSRRRRKQDAPRDDAR